MGRILRIDICDYDKNVVCNLYDNSCKVSGCAANVYITTERNGWKELSFTLPSTCVTEDGIEENFRLQFLKADYLLRTIDDYETDYFIISEPRINHVNFSKDIQVTAGHISQNLKNKAIDLEFSDTEGNNVGTADAILDAILEGTGWTRGYVEVFYEEDGVTVKNRTMNSSTGAGALSLIQQMCELFEASPVYYGDTRTIDIISMNPFSDIQPGYIPGEVAGMTKPFIAPNGEQVDLAIKRDVLELHYDRNIKNLEKTQNTENIITRLYVYGAYGDEATGYCGINVCEHDEYTLVHEQASSGTWFKFKDDDDVFYYFCITENILANDVLVFSMLDFTSRSYVWNERTRHAYHVTKEPHEATLLSTTKTSVVNKLPYLMNLNYYEEIGLLTEEMFQKVAQFQRDMPELYDISETAGANMAAAEKELSDIGGSSSGFAKLSVSSTSSLQGGSTPVDGGTKLSLNIDDYPEGGVIYRSDYDEAEKKFFTWYVATQFKANGDSYDNIGSIVFVVHNTNPVTWSKAYVTGVYHKVNGVDTLYVDETNKAKSYYYSKEDDYPSAIRVYADNFTINANDKVFLFCTNSMLGQLGTKQVQTEAVLETIETETTEVTEKHPVIFKNIPAENNTPPSNVLATYGWYYRYFDEYKPQTEEYKEGKLYFCWGARYDDSWNLVHVQETEPVAVPGQYWYSTKSKALYHCVDNSSVWSKYSSKTEERLGRMFSNVIYYCGRWDMLQKGLYEYYTYTQAQPLPAGNYILPSVYKFLWAFTTDRTISFDNNNKLKLETSSGYVYQDGTTNNIVTASVKPYDVVTYPDADDLEKFEQGGINSSTGLDVEDDNRYRCYPIIVHENTVYEYNLPSANLDGAVCFFYDKDLRFITSQILDVSGTGELTIQEYDLVIDDVSHEHYVAYPKYVRFSCPDRPNSNAYFRVKNYQNVVFIDDKQYTVLKNYGHEGDLLGINILTKRFGDKADELYGNYLPAYNTAQENIKAADLNLTNTLGEILRDNKWQDSKYVKDDEARLYTDALDNLKELAYPDTTYSFNFLDLYSSKSDDGVEWPDIRVIDAAHLVDPEIKVNCWAYIDKVNKCYDQPWLTTLEINTKLSLIGQHEFADVLSRIAQVAKEIKGKQNVYDRAAQLTAEGYVPGAILEGTIALNQVYLNGGASSYYTDPKGNIIFEAADGLSAMILGGRGLGVSTVKNADGDWVYRSALTGNGLTADVITTGYLSADRIEAGTITTDKLSSNFGYDLDISSNKSLNLFATIDGRRPAGALETVKPNEGSSWIQIAAEHGGTKAHIDVKSGGAINIESGGALNMSGGNINITATGNMTLTGGSMNITSESELNISAASQLKISGTDFGTIYDTQKRTIIQEVMGKVGTTYVQLTEPTVGGRDVMRDEEITQLNKGDIWICANHTDGSTLSTWKAVKYKNGVQQQGNENEWQDIKDFNTWGDLAVGRPTYTYNGSAWIRTSPDDIIQKAYTRISQNESQIQLEAYRATQKEGELSATLSVHSDMITSQVSRINGLDNSVSTIKQTADNILLGVAPVGALKTKGSYIEIANDRIVLASGGRLVASASQIIFTTDVTLDESLTGLDNKAGQAQTRADQAYTAAGNAQTTANSAQTAATNAQTTADAKPSVWRMNLANMVNTATWQTNQFKNKDIWKRTNSDAPFEYICKKNYDGLITANNWEEYWDLIGTSLTTGAALSINAETGTINMAAANSISIAAGASISIASGKTLTITTAGTMVIGNSSKPFTVGADKLGGSAGTSYRSYMYNGTTGINDTTNNGIYLGTDGINLGAGTFKVTAAGALTATSADISGTITASSGNIAGWEILSNALRHRDYAEGSTSVWTNGVGIVASASSSYAFYAGHTNSIEYYESPFYVTKAGILHATSAVISGTITATGGKIGDWTISGSNIYASSGSTKVQIDASTTLYPLSGLTTPSDHMYAIWTGADNPQDAPFSVTKDGIVTIKSLRIKKTNGTFDEVDLNDLGFGGDPSESEFYKNMFAKLQFQTVRKVNQDQTTGQVGITVTSNGGGSHTYYFNTATSVKLSDGAWSGATASKAATYTPSCFYVYNGSDVAVDTEEKAYISYEWGTATLNVWGQWTNKPSNIRELLGSFAFSQNNKKIQAHFSTWEAGLKQDVMTINVGVTSVTLGAHTSGAGGVYYCSVTLDDGDVKSTTIDTSAIGVSSITFSSGTVYVSLDNGNSDTKTLTSHTNCVAGLTQAKVNGNKIHGKLYYKDGSTYKEVTSNDSYWYYRSTDANPTTYYS